MAGIISIYGLVVSIILSGRIKPTGDGYRLGRSAAHLAAGLTCGFCGLGAGYAIGVVGEAGVRAHALQPRLFVTLVLILIFAEVRYSLFPLAFLSGAWTVWNDCLVNLHLIVEYSQSSHESVSIDKLNPSNSRCSLFACTFLLN